MNEEMKQRVARLAENVDPDVAMVRAEEGQDPVFYDCAYRQKRKGGKWRLVEGAHLPQGARIADTHCHLHMCPDPAFALARAAAAGVGFVNCITDPTEDGLVVFGQLDQWREEARAHLAQMAAMGLAPRGLEVPATRIAVGVHPHNARLFDAAAEAQLRTLLDDARVNVVGEIGLDYHYDLSPREEQREAFRRQIRIAHEAGLPISLHLRDAHDEALAIMNEEGWPDAGTLLHCCTVGPDQLEPWVQAGSYVAFGGAMTFNNGDAIRAALQLVPGDKLLTETDSPYMAPVPLRGVDCLPDFVSFTAQAMAHVRGVGQDEDCARFLQSLWENANQLLNR